MLCISWLLNIIFFHYSLFYFVHTSCFIFHFHQLEELKQKSLTIISSLWSCYYDFSFLAVSNWYYSSIIFFFVVVQFKTLFTLFISISRPMRVWISSLKLSTSNCIGTEKKMVMMNRTKKEQTLQCLLVFFFICALTKSIKYNSVHKLPLIKTSNKFLDRIKVQKYLDVYIKKIGNQLSSANLKRDSQHYSVCARFILFEC